MKALRLAVSLLSVSIGFFSQARANELVVAVEKAISKSVLVISTEQLALELGKENELVLLDAREKVEFSVSHLPGSVWIGYKDFDLKRVEMLPKDSLIVVYCSIGYRSEKIGERLNDAGYRNVRNLYGGIFAWANEERPLKRGRHTLTKRVHAYDQEWSRLLAPHVQKVIE